MKSNVRFIIFFVLILFRSEAQDIPSYHPFKGFHVGITGQAEFIQKCSFVSIYDKGFDPIPKGIWTYGWEAGMEFSYHFAKYFGISAGFHYGTALSYDCAIYWRTVPGYNDGWGTYYEDLRLPLQDMEIMFPIKIEFHYPLHKNIFFTADIGVKVKGIQHRLSYGKDAKGNYRSNTTVLVRPVPDDDPNIPADQIKYFSYWGEREISKIHCNLLMGIGLYYKLPYGDLLRFATGINLSFGNIVEGKFLYYLTNEWGEFTVRNDFIYTQLSYIHTLNWQKAKKYLKKNNYSFDTKKERKKKILELLSK
jgi:hypothetical protein